MWLKSYGTKKEIESINGHSDGHKDRAILDLLHDFLGIPRGKERKILDRLAGIAGKRFGLVDELIGNQEIVVKPWILDRKGRRYFRHDFGRQKCGSILMGRSFKDKR